MMSLVGILAILITAYLASAHRSNIKWRTVGGAFAIHVLTVIIFFSSLIAVLYHTGVMRIIITVLGGGLQKLLGTSRPESMSAAANIFVGQTEAPLVVRPFIPTMTRSELFAVMVGGLASVAGSVLAGYALAGVEMKYLIAASFMAAPGGLLMAKLLLPETETPKNDLSDIGVVEKSTNVIDAAASGAASGLQLALNVGAMLLAFVGLIAMANGLIGWLGTLVGFEGLTLQLIWARGNVHVRLGRWRSTLYLQHDRTGPRDGQARLLGKRVEPSGLFRCR